MNALIHLCEQGIDAPEHRSSRTMALFQRRNSRHALRAGLRRILATLTHDAERFLSSRNLLLQLGASLFERGDLRLPRQDNRFLLAPLGGEALRLRLRNLHA